MIYGESERIEALSNLEAIGKARNLPETVIQAVILRFPNEAAEILPSIERNHLGGYWYFNRWGMHVGIEDDGYIHT